MLIPNSRCVKNWYLSFHQRIFLRNIHHCSKHGYSEHQLHAKQLALTAVNVGCSSSFCRTFLNVDSFLQELKWGFFGQANSDLVSKNQAELQKPIITDHS